jgi:hypothetical protein
MAFLSNLQHKDLAELPSRAQLSDQESGIGKGRETLLEIAFLRPLQEAAQSAACAALSA